MNITMSQYLINVNSWNRCQRICLTMHQFRYAAYNNNTRECYCFRNFTEKFEVSDRCDSSVNNYAVFSTGFIGIYFLIAYRSLV